MTEGQFAWSLLQDRFFLDDPWDAAAERAGPPSPLVAPELAVAQELAALASDDLWDDDGADSYQVWWVQRCFAIKGRPLRLGLIAHLFGAYDQSRVFKALGRALPDANIRRYLIEYLQEHREKNAESLAAAWALTKDSHDQVESLFKELARGPHVIENTDWDNPFAEDTIELVDGAPFGRLIEQRRALERLAGQWSTAAGAGIWAVRPTEEQWADFLSCNHPALMPERLEGRDKLQLTVDEQDQFIASCRRSIGRLDEINDRWNTYSHVPLQLMRLADAKRANAQGLLRPGHALSATERDEIIRALGRWLESGAGDQREQIELGQPQSQEVDP